MFKILRFLLVLGVGYTVGRAYSINANTWTMIEGVLGMLLFVVVPIGLTCFAAEWLVEWVRERRLRNHPRD